MFKFKNINEGYIKLVKRIVEKPDYFQPVKAVPGWVNSRSRWHLRNVHIEFKDAGDFEGFKVKCPERSKKMNNYMHKEMILFDKGIINSDKMGNISKIWKLIENPEGTINANYGHMVYYLRDAGDPERGPAMSQWNWCLMQLTENPETLKAYMHFNRPKDQWAENRDQPCTVFTQFTVVKKKINFHSYMRSNDIIYGMPYNLAYFRILLIRMQYALKMRGIHLKLGSIYHNTTSLHLYADKLHIAKSIIE